MPKPTNLSVRLTEPLSEYVATRVGQHGDYDNASEYVRDLIRRDREREARNAFNALKQTLHEAAAQPDELAIEMDFETFKHRDQRKSA